jgi:hypothetical protein
MAFVPKRPRQAHIPAQQRSSVRKPKRPFMTASQRAEAAEELFEPNFADEPLFAGGAIPSQTGPIDTRPQPRAGRRLEMLRGSANRDLGVRVAPGQLPTYERGYLMEELRRISLISGGLLALVLVLTVVLR